MISSNVLVFQVFFKECSETPEQLQEISKGRLHVLATDPGLSMTFAKESGL